MNEDVRKQVVEKLNELRAEVAQRLGDDPSKHDPVAAHIEEVHALVRDTPADREKTKAAAGGLETRLLAWEAEHPQLTTLAARIARVLEDSGL